MTEKYSRKQWCILLIYCAINTLCASNLSLQGPFYPAIAEQKGVSPTQYGFVIGIYSFSIFIINPLVGVLICKYGSPKISLSGLSITGVTSILFGFVNKINGFSWFLGLSIGIRVLEAVGFCMVRNAGITIVSCEFSSNVEMAFACINIFTSLGQFMGPVVGGALFELGGFSLPFITVGVFLLSAAIVLVFLPKNYPESETKSTKEILRILRNPSVLLGVLSAFGVTINLGFIVTVLEPHLQNLDLSPVQVGSMFLCNAIALGLSSLIWGKLCEKYEKPSVIGCISALIIICGMLLLGPAPYFHLSKSVSTCVVALLIHGVGAGGIQIAGFSLINKGTKLEGLQQSMQTYGCVTTIFMSSSSFGFFVGPVLGGYLFETFGIPWATHFFILYHLLIFIVALIFILFWNKIIKKRENLNSKLLNSSNGNINYGNL